MNPPIARQLNLDETKLPAEIFERLSRCLLYTSDAADE